MTPATQLQHLEAEVERLRLKVRRLKAHTKRLGNALDEEHARRLALEARLEAKQLAGTLARESATVPGTGIRGYVP